MTCLYARQWDVIVVGAGVAGASLAYALGVSPCAFKLLIKRYLTPRARAASVVHIILRLNF